MITEITIKDLYNYAAENKYDEPNGRDFYKDVEAAFDFAGLPDKVKVRIHSIAWEAGHSSGYSDVVTQYFDLVDLVNLTIAEQKAAMT